MFKITNFDPIIKKHGKDIDSINFIKKTDLSPLQPCNILVTGRTGTGKSNAVLNFLFKNWLECDKLFLYTKDLEEDKYQFIISRFKDNQVLYLDEMTAEDAQAMEERAKKRKEKEEAKKAEKFKKGMIFDMDDSDSDDEEDEIKLIVSEKIENLPDPNDLDRTKHYVVVVDDMITESSAKQKRVKELFIRGRKHQITTIYIGQSYYHIPSIIRKNANVFIMFKSSDAREIMEFSKTFSSEISRDKFMKIYRMATKDPFSFLYFDPREKNDCLKYRKNIDGLYCEAGEKSKEE